VLQPTSRSGTWVSTDLLTSKRRTLSRSITIPVGDMTIAASVARKSNQPAFLLLHGWPLSRALYDGVVDVLSADFFVLAPDLPEIGDSRGKPSSADKSVLADIVLRAAEKAGARGIIIAGLDVGGMIAFAAARDFPTRISAAIVMNTVIPGIEPWSQILSDPRIWHFAFHAIPELPEILVQAHQRRYFDFFTNVLSGDPKRIPENLRDDFARAYTRREALTAGFDWYRAMAADAAHNASYKRINTPLLYMRGDADGRSINSYLDGLRRAGVDNLEGRVVVGSGELLPVEAPQVFIDVVREFALRGAHAG